MIFPSQNTPKSMYPDPLAGYKGVASRQENGGEGKEGLGEGEEGLGKGGEKGELGE